MFAKKLEECKGAGEHMTVDGKRKAVHVLCWGGPSFGRDREAYVPHGFKCITKEAGVNWLGETSVDKNLKPWYRFRRFEASASLSHYKHCDCWYEAPTAALDHANSVLNNSKHRKGYNGRLIIGVTYPTLQARILQETRVLQDLQDAHVFFSEASNLAEEPAQEQAMLIKMNESTPPITRKRVLHVTEPCAQEEKEAEDTDPAYQSFFPNTETPEPLVQSVPWSKDDDEFIGTLGGFTDDKGDDFYWDGAEEGMIEAKRARIEPEYIGEPMEI